MILNQRESPILGMESILTLPKKIDFHNIYLIIYIWGDFTHNPQSDLNASGDLFYASPQECFV